MNNFKRYIIILWLPIIFGITGVSCSLTNEEISTDPTFRLRFSADTIFFDTIFSEIPSITKRLKVYNDNNAAVSVSTISLSLQSTPYELTINGQQEVSFSNTKLLAGDSLLVLINALLEDRDNSDPYVIEDQLIFSTNGNNQEVSVFSWGQDANYIKDSVLSCNTTWVAGKPYVIYDNALIDSLCTLTIEPGTRIFSHFGSQIFVKGTIQSLGTAQDRVMMTNDRFDGDYQTFPGQWGGITFLPGSKNNLIKYTDIRNAEVGIWLGTPDNDDEPDLVIENSIIENMSSSAILSFTSDLEMNNSLVDNAGEVLVALLAGGNYLLNHNTIVNYGVGVFKSQPTFYVSDQLELSDGSFIMDEVNLNFNNCIIWGLSENEIVLENESDKNFNILTANNLLKTTDENLVGFDNIINQDPMFNSPYDFDYTLGEGSPAIDAGKDLGFILDLIGNSRNLPPDIGAYERQQ